MFFGDYPIEMKNIVKERLPTFTESERQLFLKNKPDFIALNLYSANYIEDAPAVPELGWGFDVRVKNFVTDLNGKLIGKQAQSSWLYVVPWSIRKSIEWVHFRYGHPNIFITENGVSAPKEDEKPISEVVVDDFRVDYLKQYISEVWNALNNGVNLKGYFVWSLLDNYEWSMGYHERFGIHYVDYNSTNLDRYPKKSSAFYSKIIDSGCVD